MKKTFSRREFLGLAAATAAGSALAACVPVTPPAVEKVVTEEAGVVAAPGTPAVTGPRTARIAVGG